jgi:hypothetical protein
MSELGKKFWNFKKTGPETVKFVKRKKKIGIRSWWPKGQIVAEISETGIASIFQQKTYF